MTVHQSYIHRLLKVYFWLSIKSRGIICDQTEQVMKIAKVSWNLRGGQRRSMNMKSKYENIYINSRFFSAPRLTIIFTTMSQTSIL